MPIQILVNGAFGRMGQLTVKAIQADPRFNLVGQTGREYDLKKAIQDSGAQVVVDFTCAEAVFNNTLTIIEARARPVIGTSGLKQEQITSLSEQCHQLKLGGIVAPNFSIGGVLMMQLAKEISKHILTVEIIEMHHLNKDDTPSGTAIRTAEMIAQTQKNINQAQKSSHETIPGSRGSNYLNIPIHAIRLPGVLAHQDVIFSNAGETLTLSHNSIDRQCFIPGVCLSCEKVMALDHLVYGLEEIL